MGRWLLYSAFCFFVFALGVSLRHARMTAPGPAKTADRYWAETSLKPEALEDVVDDELCRSSQRYFLACANAVASVADRVGLHLSTSGELSKAQVRYGDITEKSFLTPWKAFFETNPEAAQKFSFRTVWHTLIRDYVSSERKSSMTGAAFNGFLSVFRDPHTYVLPADYYQEVVAKANTSTLALGVVLARGRDSYFLRKVVEGSASDKAGLKRGDRVLAVNGIDLGSVPPQRLGELLKAEDGETTRLKISRAGEKSEVSIPRIHTEMSSVTWRRLDGVRPIGLMTLHKFAHDSCQETKVALQQMNKAHLRGMLLDLRDNAGGQMDEAACIVSLFLGPEKEAFRIKYLDPSKDPETYFGPEQKIWDGALAILINSGSASASEILAGSLRDHGRAVLVGERTFGKGSFQEGEFWSRNHKVAFFQTKGFYYLPSGFSPQLRGIEPDVAVAMGDSIPYREQDQYLNPLNPPVLTVRHSVAHMDLSRCLDADDTTSDDQQLSKAKLALFCGTVATGASHAHF